MPRLLFQEFEPAVLLASHIVCYWTMVVAEDDAPPEHHRVWPDGCISLAFRQPRGGEPASLSAVGPHQRAFDVPIRAGDTYYGARMWPDAGGTLLGIDPNAIRNQVGPTAVLLPQPHDDLCQQLVGCDSIERACHVFDTYLAPLIRSADPLDPLVRQGLVAIIGSRGMANTADIARQAGVSERQFQRRFRRAVGLTPKQFARIRRFRSTSEHILAASPRWATVAAELGYADQSHLIRDMSQLTGLTPTAFAHRVREIEHRDVRP